MRAVVFFKTAESYSLMTDCIRFLEPLQSYSYNRKFFVSFFFFFSIICRRIWKTAAWAIIEKIISVRPYFLLLFPRPYTLLQIISSQFVLFSVSRFRSCIFVHAFSTYSLFYLMKLFIIQTYVCLNVHDISYNEKFTFFISILSTVLSGSLQTVYVNLLP